VLVRFWGVRGSLPSPISPQGIKEKINAILEMALPEDLANAESRQRFISALPPWLYGTVGGNSPCVSITIDGFNEPIIFDCGSGLRDFGVACAGFNPMPQKYHMFFSHFHWDHLLGLPFFTPAYQDSARIDFYSPVPGLKKILGGKMRFPYFPVKMDTMPAKKVFHHVEQQITLGPATIAFRKMNHPGESFSYLVSHKGKRFIYATDAELAKSDFKKNRENAKFFKDADMIVLDSQYTMDEAIDKSNWGHNSFSTSVEFAAHWGIKHLVLFHHDPAYDDLKLAGMLQSARWHLERMGIQGMEISLATEDLEISL